MRNGLKAPAFTAAFAALAVLSSTPTPGQERPPLVGSPAGNVAPYYPTPVPVVRLMLETAEIEPGEVLYDLGSGDGRVVILAARDHQAKAVGFELDPKLVESSRRQIDKMELSDRARIVPGDLYAADVENADVVTVYLLPRALGKLRPLLEKKMKSGSRVVSHDFPIPGWEADETLTYDETNEVDGLPHTVYLYRR